MDRLSYRLSEYRDIGHFSHIRILYRMRANSRYFLRYFLHSVGKFSCMITLFPANSRASILIMQWMNGWMGGCLSVSPSFCKQVWKYYCLFRLKTPTRSSYIYELKNVLFWLHKNKNFLKKWTFSPKYDVSYVLMFLFLYAACMSHGEFPESRSQRGRI